MTREKSEHCDGTRFFNPGATTGQPLSAVLRMLMERRTPWPADLEAFESIGMHFGTFPMTTEGIDEPLRALGDACLARRIPPSAFRTLGFGESVRVGQTAPA